MKGLSGREMMEMIKVMLGIRNQLCLSMLSERIRGM